MAPFKNLVIGTIVIFALLQAQMVWAKSIYRWIDENGETQVSTILPPGVAERGYEVLRNGIVIKKVGPALTRLEIKRRHRRDQLRAEAQAILDQAEREDIIIEITYSSVEEVIKAESNRIAGLNNNLLNNLKRIQQKEEVLLEKQEQAAAVERAGNPVPNRLRKEIENLLEDIMEAEAQNRFLEQKKIIVRKDFADLKKKVRKRVILAKVEKDYAANQNKGPTTKVVTMFDAVECTTIQKCAEAWTLAKEYLLHHSTTPIIRDKAKAVETAKPRNSQDISLVLTRLQREGEGSLLFLDVICRDDKYGHRLCNSDRVRSIRQNFRAYVTRE